MCILYNSIRPYDIWVYNNEKDYKQINLLHLDQEDVNRSILELQTKGTYFYNKYKNYKYYIVIDNLNNNSPIKELLRNVTEHLTI